MINKKHNQVKGAVKLIRLIVLVILSGIVVFGCKTPQMAGETKAKSISTGRLIKKIRENALEDEYFSIKRINIQYNDEKSKSSFRANLKTRKDDKIVVSFNKLNIPVGKILLTPDSVKYINYVDKNYYVGDYVFLSEMFKIDLDFYDIQEILRNSIFSFRDNPGDNDFRDFTSYIDSNRYKVQSVKKRKLKKIVQKEKSQKVKRILKRFEDEAFILQSIFVTPGNFNIERIKIDNETNKQSVKFDFDDYVGIGDKNYPGAINMNFNSIDVNINMKIRLSGFSTEYIKAFNFRIPSKYERFYIDKIGLVD